MKRNGGGQMEGIENDQGKLKRAEELRIMKEQWARCCKKYFELLEREKKRDEENKKQEKTSCPSG